MSGHKGRAPLNKVRTSGRDVVRGASNKSYDNERASIAINSSRGAINSSQLPSRKRRPFSALNTHSKSFYGPWAAKCPSDQPSQYPVGPLTCHPVWRQNAFSATCLRHPSTNSNQKTNRTLVTKRKKKSEEQERVLWQRGVPFVWRGLSRRGDVALT